MSDTIKDPNKSVPHPVKTDHEIGQNNITPFGLDIHNPVFLISGISILVFVLITLMFQEGAAQFFNWLRPFLTSNFAWLFLSAGNVFCYLHFSSWYRLWEKFVWVGRRPSQIIVILVGLRCYLQPAWASV